MKQNQKVLLLLLRLALGWLFLYSGFLKITDPGFSAAGYLSSAENFSSLYGWFASDAMIGVTNFLNSYGQVLLGISLILGAFVRLSTILGAVLMLLYYFVLPFPQQDSHSFIVDDHIVYGLSLLLLGALNAGAYWGLEDKLKNSNFIKSVPFLHKLVS